MLFRIMWLLPVRFVVVVDVVVVVVEAISLSFRNSVSLSRRETDGHVVALPYVFTYSE
jgi:hypothetical protein